METEKAIAAPLKPYKFSRYLSQSTSKHGKRCLDYPPISLSFLFDFYRRFSQSSFPSDSPKSSNCLSGEGLVVVGFCSQNHLIKVLLAYDCLILSMVKGIFWLGPIIMGANHMNGPDYQCVWGINLLMEFSGGIAQSLLFLSGKTNTISLSRDFSYSISLVDVDRAHG